MRAGAVSDFVTCFWNSTPPTGFIKTKHNFHIESLDLNMFLLSLLACSWGTWNNVLEGEIISHSSPYTKSHFSSLFSHSPVVCETKFPVSQADLSGNE